MLPLPITGPVGCPVGDPPGGSTDTANAAVGPRRASNARGSAIVVGESVAIIPTAIGFCPAGISHSSGARPVGIACGLAGTTTMRACCKSIVAVQPTCPSFCAIVDAMYATAGAAGGVNDARGITIKAMMQAAATAAEPKAKPRHNERLFYQLLRAAGAAARCGVRPAPTPLWMRAHT